MDIYIYKMIVDQFDWEQCKQLKCELGKVGGSASSVHGQGRNLEFGIRQLAVYAYGCSVWRELS